MDISACSASAFLFSVVIIIVFIICSPVTVYRISEIHAVISPFTEPFLYVMKAKYVEYIKLNRYHALMYKEGISSVKSLHKRHLRYINSYLSGLNDSRMRK